MTQPKDSKTEVSTDLTARREAVERLNNAVVCAHDNYVDCIRVDDLRAILSLLPSPTAQGEAVTREETDMEHIARDMRDGVFPDRSERKLVPDRPAEWWLNRAASEPNVIIGAGLATPQADVTGLVEALKAIVGEKNEGGEHVWFAGKWRPFREVARQALASQRNGAGE